jgi:uncharacterized protein (DUF427 family)
LPSKESCGTGIRVVTRQRTHSMVERARESVWDYPRPPAIEHDTREVVIVHAGRELVRTTDAVRVLETSHPPAFYVPSRAVAEGVLVPNPRRTFCEFKGMASYVDAVVDGHRTLAVGWTYPQPSPGYEELAGMVSFYAGRLDHCTVGGDRVIAQPGDFYGGWITAEIEGPFKGGPGTMGW